MEEKDKMDDKINNPDNVEVQDREDQGKENDSQPELKLEENEETGSVQDEEQELEPLKKDLEESKEKYLRLYSEFDNYRRRTARERLDLIKTANEDLMVALLPILDDFQRARKAMDEKSDPKALEEGFNLIHNKFNKILDQKGLKPIEVEKGSEFSTEYHDAITQMPVKEEDLKGKVVDVIEKGYYLGDKVIRFAKVVIGS
jgi:molecular chaperone GrpE